MIWGRPGPDPLLYSELRRRSIQDMGTYTTFGENKDPDRWSSSQCSLYMINIEAFDCSNKPQELEITQRLIFQGPLEHRQHSKR